MKVLLSRCEAQRGIPNHGPSGSSTLKAVLDAYGGDIQRTGLALGIARSTVYRKMKRYKLR